MAILPGRREPVNVTSVRRPGSKERWPLVSLASEARALDDDALSEQAELLAEVPSPFWPIAYTRLAIVARELARRLVERRAA